MGASVGHRDGTVASAAVVASIPRDSSGTSDAEDRSDASPHHPVSGDDTSHLTDGTRNAKLAGQQRQCAW